MGWTWYQAAGVVSRIEATAKDTRRAENAEEEAKEQQIEKNKRSSLRLPKSSSIGGVTVRRSSLPRKSSITETPVVTLKEAREKAFKDARDQLNAKCPLTSLDRPLTAKPNQPGDSPGQGPPLFRVHERVVDAFWYAVVLLFFIVFPQVSVQAISAFNCKWVGDPNGKELLASDWREDCPLEDKGGFIFLWSALFTLLYPIGLPIGLFLILEFFNVPSVSTDLINSFRLKALLDSCGYDYNAGDDDCDDEYAAKFSHEEGDTSKSHNRTLADETGGRQIRMEQCFFQNLITCLGKEPAVFDAEAAKHAGEKDLVTVSRCLDLNNKIRVPAQGQPDSADANLEFKKELLRMDHKAVEDVTAKLLDPEKLNVLQQKCWDHFTDRIVEEEVEELKLKNEPQNAAKAPDKSCWPCRKKEDKGNKEGKEDKVKDAIKKLVTCKKCSPSGKDDKSRPGKDDNFSKLCKHSDRDWQSCNHDDLIDLAKLLIDEERIGLPALGWKDDNQFNFQSDESHEGRSFGADLQAKLNFFLGATDIEFFSNRDFQFAKCHAIARAGFLFRTYEVKYWYFELIEMLRKLLMTSVMVFLYPGTPSQLAFALVFSLIFLVWFMSAKPYLDPELDLLQTTTLVAQHCTLLYGVMAIMRENLEETGNSAEADLVGWVVTMLNVLCVLVPAVKYLIQPEKIFNKIRGYYGACRNKSSAGDPQGNEDHDNDAASRNLDLSLNETPTKPGAGPSTQTIPPGHLDSTQNTQPEVDDVEAAGISGLARPALEAASIMTPQSTNRGPATNTSPTGSEHADDHAAGVMAGPETASIPLPRFPGHGAVAASAALVITSQPVGSPSLSPSSKSARGAGSEEPPEIDEEIKLTVNPATFPE